MISIVVLINGDAENQGAGDQGMMFGYACNETDNYMPVTLDLAHLLMTTLSDIRKEGKQMTYLRPDSKSQVTVEYSDDNIPQRIDTIVVSTQHDDFIKPADDSREAQLKADKEMVEQIHKDVLEILMPRVKAQITSEKVLALFNDNIKYLVNPTGKFVIGGPHGDTGLTGRKIIVDTYGGKGGHGGGAFSGKDSSKVDRSAAYATRYIAKNMVAAGVSDEILVQLAYAIGVAEPVSVYVNTYGRSHVKATDGEIAEMVKKLFDLRPKAIEKTLSFVSQCIWRLLLMVIWGVRMRLLRRPSKAVIMRKRQLMLNFSHGKSFDRVEDIKKDIRTLIDNADN